MPILDVTNNPPSFAVNPGNPGILQFYKDGSDPSTGFQVTSEGLITAPAGIVSPGSDGTPPAFNGLLAWAYDPAAAVNQSAPTAGVVTMAKVWLNAPATVSNFSVRTTGTAGVGLANSFMGLYDMNGNLLAQTADLSASWSSGTANRSHAMLTPVSLAAGFYYIAWLIGSATTMVNFSRSAGVDVINNNLAAGTYRSCTFGSSLTALPSTIALGSTASYTNALWGGIF